METIKIRLARIRIDGGTQNRVSINPDTVSEYAEAMTEGAVFPPVILFFDGADYWMADGFHRYHAAKSIDALDIDSVVTNGTQRDAKLYSFGANGTHGLQRTNADKRKAVADMLKDEVWAAWSDREIARHCLVSKDTVGRIRKEIVTVSLDSEKSEASAKRVFKDKHGNESVMNTSNIGKKENVTVALDSEKLNQGENKNESSKNNENRRQENDQNVQGGEGEDFGESGDGDDTDERDQIIKEQSDVIEDLVKENDRIKALLANNQVPEGLEVPDVDTMIDAKNARIKQLEIELKAVTTSRDSLMLEVNQLKQQVKKYQAVLKKQTEVNHAHS